MNNKAYVIRTCDKDMKAHGGFQWPKSGRVEAPDWSAVKECGKGLHGLIDGVGDYDLLSNDADAHWLVCEVDRSLCVELGGKVKFPYCDVVYCGGMAGALTLIAKEWRKTASAAVTTGDWANAATTGYRANAATTGYRANAATTGDRANAATTGYSANAATTGNWANAATTGKNAIAACLGLEGKAKAGENGVVILAYWNAEKKRVKVAVGHVGERGIKAGVWYRVNEKYKLERCE